jgi:hypothetical protein
MILLMSDIYDSLKATGYEAPSAENVVVEIFDILGCNDARYSEQTGMSIPSSARERELLLDLLLLCI